MPTLQQEKLNKLTEILKMMDENISKAEFVKSFENVIKQIIEIEKKLIEKIDNKTKSILDEFAQIKQEFAGIIDQAKKESDSTFGGFRRRSIEAINSIFEKNQVRQKLNQALSGVENKIQEINDKISQVKDGKDGKPGSPGKDGKDGSPDTAEEIRNSLESLSGKERLSKDAIDGLEEALKGTEKNGRVSIFGGSRPIQIQQAGTAIDKYARVLNFTGATITTSQGVTTIAVAGAGGTPIYEEVPTDSGDHINFTIAHTPATGTFRLYRGGTRQRAAVDYVRTGTALVLTTALDTANGEEIIADYNY